MCSFTCSRRTTRETGFGVLTGHPPMVCERVEGVWGNREVPPHREEEGGNVGETWFPPRERAEGERRSREDLHDAGRAVDTQAVAGLDRRGRGRGADDRGDPELARDDGGMRDGAARVGDAADA